MQKGLLMVAYELGPWTRFLSYKYPHSHPLYLPSAKTKATATASTNITFSLSLLRLATCTQWSLLGSRPLLDAVVCLSEKRYLFFSGLSFIAGL
ncbi:hypothetical protein F0562_001669 [Nyssa sinensis]|uniref:Uncharacterized protein n=1 Tax=Nyssa sinensis TaxID=561372 RepID=A0A5J5C559_9ASTE|nr:hypothetical protein F0562_001669 [Nyssa sinensis]